MGILSKKRSPFLQLIILIIIYVFGKSTFKKSLVHTALF